MKKIISSKALNILLIIFVTILVVIFSILIVARPYCKSDISYKQVLISKGSTTEDVATTLVENGIIKSEGRFIFLSSILFYNNKYKPGVYSLSASMDMNQIAKVIINGISTQDGFDIPAGYTVAQTAEGLDQAGFVDKNKFLSLCKNLDYSQFDFLKGASSLEGFLMPGNYKMAKEASEEMILITMLNQFDQNYTAEYKAKAESLGLSTYQVVSLASYLQKQTNKEKEYKVISSVIHNRLAQGMKLDGYTGAPICSPSIEAIEAILYPESTIYLYYVFDESLNGTHKFTDSAEEYQKLLDAYNKAYEKKQAEKEQ